MKSPAINIQLSSRSTLLQWKHLLNFLDKVFYFQRCGFDLSSVAAVARGAKTRGWLLKWGAACCAPTVAWKPVAIGSLHSIGSVDVNAGYGQAHLDQSSFDEMKKLNINRAQHNIYMGVQYHIAPLTFVAELNLLHHEWYLGNTQNVTIFSLGADFAY